MPISWRLTHLAPSLCYRATRPTFIGRNPVNTLPKSRRPGHSVSTTSRRRTIRGTKPLEISGHYYLVHEEMGHRGTGTPIYPWISQGLRSETSATNSLKCAGQFERDADGKAGDAFRHLGTTNGPVNNFDPSKRNLRCARFFCHLIEDRPSLGRDGKM
jgi:hypothetical protein